MSVQLVLLYQCHSSSRIEQSKQYLQVRWRAHRRSRHGLSTSMALVRICSSAARSWVSLCSLTPLIFIQDQASAPNVTQKQVSKWCGVKKGRANQISMLNALWDGVLTVRGHFKGDLQSKALRQPLVCFCSREGPVARVCRPGPSSP